MEPITYEKIDHMYQATWNQQNVYAENQAASQIPGAQLNVSFRYNWAASYLCRFRFLYMGYDLWNMKYLGL